MPSSTTTPFPQTTQPLSRVCVERRIFVGDDRDAFIKEWLEQFDADYGQGRIEGYVLDLTGGELLAELVLSDVSDAAYRDIALRSVQHNDVRASEVFRSLTRTCDPVTAVNTLTCSFDANEWPQLAKVCEVFTRRHASPVLRPANADVSWQIIEGDNSPVSVMAVSAGQSEHVFHCVLTSASEKGNGQRNTLDASASEVTDDILELRLNEETAEVIEQMVGSPLPEMLDIDDANFLLSCIDELLQYRDEISRAHEIQELRQQVFSISNLAVARGL
jgi:hypothetical protein